MKTTPMTPPLYDYVLQQSDLPHAVLKKVEETTRSLPGAQMMISPDQGMFLHLLIKLMGAHRVLEVGCFTGYSAISMASALPDSGRLISLDVNEETSKIARNFFAEAGLANKIDLRLGEAFTTLGKIKVEFGDGSFDLAFIDADKANLWTYYELGLELLRTGGLIIVDNVIWDGKVIDGNDRSNSTEAIRSFNKRVRTDSRVEHLMLHIADGLYLLRKK